MVHGGTSSKPIGPSAGDVGDAPNEGSTEGIDPSLILTSWYGLFLEGGAADPAAGTANAAGFLAGADAPAADEADAASVVTGFVSVPLCIDSHGSGAASDP